jgi:hypothetical protein
VMVPMVMKRMRNSTQTNLVSLLFLALRVLQLGAERCQLAVEVFAWDECRSDGAAAIQVKHPPRTSSSHAAPSCTWRAKSKSRG